LSTFLENQAGPSWANQRRKQVGEQVRRSIVDGWQGWQAVEISRDKEISVVVEVEVEEEEKVEDVIMSEPVPDAKAPTVPAPSAPSTTASVAGEEEEGWDFEEPQLDSQPEAGPSSPRKSLHDTADADDGWAFDDDLSAPTPAPAPAPIKPAKPAREAKKLGKKVAKSKVVQDEHESGNESMPGTDMSRSSSIQSPLPPRAPSPEVKSGGMDWAAWDDEPVKKEESKPKAKRKVLKEEKRTIKETFLVSAACDSLLELVEQVLRDAQEISLS
jgi:centromere/kinetochore protein ZW10